MKKTVLRLTTLVSLAVVAGCEAQVIPSTPPPAAVEQHSQPAMMASTGNPKTAAEKVANAMSAAPDSIAHDAAVADYPGADGKLVELRKGTNGWTCLPDLPSSPGNDPICVDGMALQWFAAYMGKTEPKLAQTGIGYMLQGGSDASNTDPFAEKPAPGEDWMNAPPHIMLFPSGKLDAAVYGTDMMAGGPWIMWAGTPYEHLMVPVK